MICGPTLPVTADIPERPAAPLRVAVSDCLLGAPVRYDGGHKKTSLPHDELAGLFEFVGFCPEMAIGLGTPREPIRLVGQNDDYAAIGVFNGRDFTGLLDVEAQRVLPEVAQLSAYIFMHNSPSCGLHQVKVFAPDGRSERRGRGIYARRLSELRPALPMVEGAQLFDSALRENFVTRVFVYAHWQRLLASQPSAAALVEFHSRHKYLLMAHSVPHLTAAGHALSDLSGGAEAVQHAAQIYFRELMAGLSTPATRGGHANALAHLQGYVKRALNGPDRAELSVLIEDYRRGLQPLAAPLTLLRHQLQQHASDYARRQVYLEPHPPAVAQPQQPGVKDESTTT